MVVHEITHPPRTRTRTAHRQSAGQPAPLVFLVPLLSLLLITVPPLDPACLLHTSSLSRPLSTTHTTQHTSNTDPNDLSSEPSLNLHHPSPTTPSPTYL